MSIRFSFSFPLPIGLLLLFVFTVAAQTPDTDPFGGITFDNPVASSTQRAPDRNTNVDDDRVVKFMQSIAIAESAFKNMVEREKVLKQTIDDLQKQLELAPKDDNAAKQTIAQYQAISEQLKTVAKELRLQNENLKTKINSLVESEQQARSVANDALTKRNELHQTLFRRLLMSNSPKEQSMALVHLFECVDKYGDDTPITIYQPELLKRIGELSESTNSEVYRLSSKALFAFRKETAIDLGIQYGDRWVPVEESKSSIGFQKINQILKEPCSLEYDEAPLWEVLEEFQIRYNANFQLAPDVEKEKNISFQIKDAPVADALAAMLDKYQLSFAVRDNAITVMKNSDPNVLVLRTYNVRSLIEDASGLSKLLKVVEQVIADEAIELTKVNDYVFTAKASESDQRKISRQLAVFSKPAKWYAK